MVRLKTPAPQHNQDQQIVVDFRRPRPHLVELVQTSKYLGVQSNDKLDWTANTGALYKRRQSRLLSQKAGILQHLQQAAADVLSDCSGEHPSVCSGVPGVGT